MEQSGGGTLCIGDNIELQTCNNDPCSGKMIYVTGYQNLFLSVYDNVPSTQLTVPGVNGLSGETAKKSLE